MDPAALRSLPRRYALRSGPWVLPAVGLTASAGALGWSAAPALADLARASVRRPAPDVWVVGGLLGGFVLGLSLLAWFFWRQLLAGRHGLVADPPGDAHDVYVRVVPGLLGGTAVVPAPPTAATGAVDFTDERDVPFEERRRTFTFARPEVAAEFARLNAERVVHPDAPRARRAARARRVVWRAVLALGAAGLLRECATALARR